MRVKTFMQLLEQLKQLTPRQRNVLAHHLGDPNLSTRQGFLKQSSSVIQKAHGPEHLLR